MSSRWIAPILLLFLTPLYAQAPSVVTSADFARDASEHFNTQIAAARIAKEKSTDPAVKGVASQLATRYEEADRTLAALCEQLKIDVPQLLAGRAAAGAVATTSGSEFDNVSMLELSQGLARAETSFKAAIESPKVDAKLKDFARRQLETVREERKRVDPLARKQATPSPPEGRAR